MKLLIALVMGVAGACLLAPSTASAQATRTWVSGVGDDANPCSRTAPCKTFAGAYSKTAIAGEINCLDPGGFGAVTISKSLAIKCDYVAEAGVLVSGTNGIVITAGGADVVWLSGLDFEGLGPSALSLNGIKFISGGTLHVSDCWIRGFGSNNGTDGNGIFFNPSTGTPKLFVDNVYVADNANVGIEVRPAAGAGASVEIRKSRAANNAAGFRANGASGAAAINVDIFDSVAFGNAGAGVKAAGPGPAQVMIDHSTMGFNGVGIGADGSSSIVRVGASSITGNVTSTSATNSGQVLSYSNNQINGNTNELPYPGGIMPH
jgi:hypothetical protein